MQGLELAQQINFKEGEADCFLLLMWNNGNIGDSIAHGLNALKIYTQIKNQVGIGTARSFAPGWIQGNRRLPEIPWCMRTKQKILLSRANLVCKLIRFAGHRLKPLTLLRRLDRLI